MNSLCGCPSGGEEREKEEEREEGEGEGGGGGEKRKRKRKRGESVWLVEEEADLHRKGAAGSE